MKTKLTSIHRFTFALLLTACVWLLTLSSPAAVLGTAFTYQGRLIDGGTAANGIYDIQFSLFDAASAGGAVGSALIKEDVAVTNGLFTVELDFGPGIFTGNARWLAMGVRPGVSTGGFATLPLRQALTPAPNASFAVSAGNATSANSVPASGITGTVPDARLSANVALLGGSPAFTGVVTAPGFNGAFFGNGAGLTNLPGGGGGSIVGLRTEPNAASGAPNIINGSTTNFVAAGTVGATISGGGATDYDTGDGGVSIINSIAADFAAIGGGGYNRILAGGEWATIAGGHNNSISAYQSTIGGGVQNSIESGAPNSTIGGGTENVISAYQSTVGGGSVNRIQSGAGYGTIGGGYVNTIRTSAEYSTVGGGVGNTIETNVYSSTIGGGLENKILGNAYYATIPGGYRNTANYFAFAAGYRAKATNSGSFVWSDTSDFNADFGSTADNQFSVRAGGGVRFETGGAGLTVDGNPVGGGGGSIVGIRTEPNVASGAPNIIGGAPVNFVGAGVIGATISGGGTTNYFSTPFTNSILANFGTIGGGYGNTIQTDSVFAGIGAGRFNTIGTNASESTIGGGIRNWIKEGAFRSTISGGEENTVQGGYYSTIAGGYLNNASGAYSFIAGGDRNAAAAGSFAAGMRAKATNFGSFVWSDYAEADFGSTTNNQFNVRASGGARFVTAGAGLTVDGVPVLTGTGLRTEPNVASGAPNLIGGSPINYVAPGVVGATIAGGGATNWFGLVYSNSILADFGFIGGGRYNTIQGADHSTIGGGAANTIQNSAHESTIGGGGGNHIQTAAFSSTISGGSANTIQTAAAYSTISGGWLNTIQTNAAYSRIGGGRENRILTNAQYSTISGGYRNTIETNAQYSMIGGGSNNKIGTNTYYSTIGNGDANWIGNSASNSTIGGGYANFIHHRAQYAVIPGGLENEATTNGFAAGYHAFAVHAGAFVWSDGTGTDTASAAANSVTLRGSGGFRFFTDTGTAGVQLAPGATSWSFLSDRNIKKNFQPLDAQAVLEKLSQMPIKSWNYKWEKDGDVPHIGPVAQDFKAAFYPGRDDKSITTLEADGVELAAIQGLNQKLEERLKAKDAAISSLQERLAALEKLVGTLVNPK